MKEYDLNKIVEIDGQRITIKKVKVYPTRIGVDIETAIENSKTLFTFEDLRFENENGDVWAGVTNG